MYKWTMEDEFDVLEMKTYHQSTRWNVFFIVLWNNFVHTAFHAHVSFRPTLFNFLKTFCLTCHVLNRALSSLAKRDAQFRTHEEFLYVCKLQVGTEMEKISQFFFWFHVHLSNVSLSNDISSNTYVLSNANILSKMLFCLTMFGLMTF
jgi:hypothetical protein